MRSDYGMKVSLPGVDVKKASKRELSVHNRSDYLKVDPLEEPLLFGFFEFNVNIATNQFKKFKTIKHKFGFTPQVIAHFVRRSNNAYGLLPYYFNDSGIDAGFFRFMLYPLANDKEVSFNWLTSSTSVGSEGGDETFDVRYYIFANKPKDK